MITRGECGCRALRRIASRDSSMARTFDAYWDAHVQAAVAAAQRHAASAVPPPQASASANLAERALEEVAI